jgi:exopolysaccharide biosynthesis protein
MPSAAALLALLASLNTGSPLAPLPPLPPQVVPGEGRSTGRSGARLDLNGELQQARWQLSGSTTDPTQLWLPLEVLQNQLGVESRSLTSGGLRLNWFGRERDVPPDGLRPLEDEVAIDAAALLRDAGVTIAVTGDRLSLTLPPTRLLDVRSSSTAGARRIVLDLAGQALVRRDGERLWLSLVSTPAQQAELNRLGLTVQQSDTALGLQPRTSAPQRLLTLGDPARIVIDLPPGPAAATQPAQPDDPRLMALLGRDLHWDRQVHGAIRLNAVRLDPRNTTLELRPLTRSGGMEGLSSLQQLAAREDALVAINGGFFNRVKKLPLGALRVEGRWLSGPILSRGVVAWSPGTMPRFGRLSLDEAISDPGGNSRPITLINSGYLQRGLSRYTADWGPSYRALSGDERALVIRNGRVVRLWNSAELNQGVPLRSGEILVVARGGTELPWEEGSTLTITARNSDPLADAPFVIGGGPLLLQNGRIVLNGSLENFSGSFLEQGAPRTVIAGDGTQLWLITLEGIGNAGPSLGETASLLRRLGLTEALNLDGGSSTGLVLGGVMTVKGRGVAGAVHHGLGLVPKAVQACRPGARQSGSAPRGDCQSELSLSHGARPAPLP